MSEARLPVWRTVTHSYGWVRHHPRLLALPMALLFAAQFLQETLSARLAPDAWGKIAATFLLLLVDSAISVGLFRTVILDEVRSGFAFLRWGFELWRYLKTVLIATLGVILLGLAVMLTIGSKLGAADFPLWQKVLALSVPALPLLYLAARLILAFPAAALGEDRLFILSWRASRGNALRLLAVLALSTLLPTLLDALLASPLATPAGGPLAFLSAALSSIVDVLDTALVTTALALSYRILVPARLSSEEAPL